VRRKLSRSRDGVLRPLHHSLSSGPVGDNDPYSAAHRGGSDPVNREQRRNLSHQRGLRRNSGLAVIPDSGFIPT
jgi:hypothetical protein